MNRTDKKLGCPKSNKCSAQEPLVEMTATLNVVVSINSPTVMQTYWTTPFKMRCLHQVRCNPATDYGLRDSYEYDDYDRLIQFIDSTCNADGTKNLEKRMEDVKNRYGYYPQAKYDKNTELKTYFEKLMGKDLNTVLQ